MGDGNIEISGATRHPSFLQVLEIWNWNISEKSRLKIVSMSKNGKGEEEIK